MSTGLETLIALHKAQLGAEAVKLFPAAADADFVRHLDLGAKQFTKKRQILKRASITLIANQAIYAAPVDMDVFSRHEWGAGALTQFSPWDPAWPGPFPEVQIQVNADAEMELVFSPPPTELQLALLGSEFFFWYYAKITTLSVRSQDEPLLLLAALIEAVRELSTRNVVSPIQLHKGMSSTATAQTPLAWYQELMKEWTNTS
jgi:hypothetical protein